MKQLSRELLTLVRLSSLLPQSTAIFSPTLTRRLEKFIVKKDIEEAGPLADFMTNVVESAFEEKLEVLSALDIRTRLRHVTDILTRQINGIKGNVKVTSLTGTSFPAGIDITKLPRPPNDTLLRRRLGGLVFGNGSPGSPGMPQGGDDGEAELNELDELKQKLDAAGLTPEAQRVAGKELKRLRKINPAQAEYSVSRTYLETLAEVPWSKLTEDRMGVETLRRARKQLDDDHYGLEKIKKRLLEYLAVLRLKQAVNADVESRVEKATEEASNVPRSESDTTFDTEPDRQDAKIQLLRSKYMVDKSPILLLCGPPGTGKTSLARSVATALGREFHRISLGGVRDEAEIRGHRRTYVAAMPGLIVNGLKKVGVRNPVFLLDEIDKLGGANFHGDPSAAMLEVLDPEQNHTFVDHYLNIPLDLSKVLFIATANSLDTIPLPLLDRMEAISLPGYTSLEKKHIADRHLLPKQARTNGLDTTDIRLEPGVFDAIIASYTREAGVRSLEREIGAVCRFKAVEFSDAQDSQVLSSPHDPSKDAELPSVDAAYTPASVVDPSSVTSTSVSYNPTVKVSDLETILGVPRFEDELAEEKLSPGTVTGLVAYHGIAHGSILFIEVVDIPSATSGGVRLTGKLGDVLKESVEVALTWVRAHAFELGLTRAPNEDLLAGRSVHVHATPNAVPKDGPSAGLAHTMALVGLFSGKTAPATMAMTGEVSLRGKVLSVGGIREKLIGAHRAGVKTVLLPKGNAKDVKEVPEEVMRELEIVEVERIWEALRVIWPDVPWAEDWVVESRL